MDNKKKINQMLGGSVAMTDRVDILLSYLGEEEASDFLLDIIETAYKTGRNQGLKEAGKIFEGSIH